jgi:hypothetical protein
MFLYSSIYKYVNLQHSVFTNNFTSNLSHVPTSGMLDKYLSLMDTCHVVETVHLCKYRPPLRLQTTVGKSKTSHRNHQRLFVCQTENYFWFSSFLLQIDWPSARVVWTRSRLPGKYLGSAPEYKYVPNIYQLWEQYTTFIALKSSTVQDFWNDCQIHQPCERSLVTNPSTCTNSLRLVTALFSSHQ